MGKHQKWSHAMSGSGMGGTGTLSASRNKEQGGPALEKNERGEGKMTFPNDTHREDKDPSTSSKEVTINWTIILGKKGAAKQKPSTARKNRKGGDVIAPINEEKEIHLTKRKPKH